MGARPFALLLAALAPLGCERASVSGPAGMWMNGESLRAKISLSQGLVSAELRNDSGKVADIDPVIVTVWFQRAGKRELVFSSDPPTLPTGRTFTTGPVFSEDPVTARDRPERAQVSAGAGRSREVFAVAF